MAGTGLATEAHCRRAPDGSWWAEVAAPWQRSADLARAAGGRPYAPDGGRWVPVAASGAPSLRPGDGTDLDPAGWAEVELPDIVAEVPLRAGRLTRGSELNVMTPGVLGRWVLHRALSLGVSVSLIPATRALGGRGEEAGVLLIRLRSEGSAAIPAALVHTLSSLPYTVAGLPIGTDGRRLVVDARCQAALPTALIAGMIPEGETWVLGAADVGHWSLRAAGEEVDSSHLIEPPDVAITPAPPPGDSHLPEPIPVRVVNRSGGAGRVDAVLLDDDELDWVRPFLAGRPAGETSFLLPGPGVHLLTAPGGLPTALPFGAPLTRVGPRGLYLELGLDFFPPLPDGAREHTFDLREGTAVAVTRSGSYRFDVDQMVPAWTLWVGDAPKVVDGLGWRGERLLSQISRSIRDAEARQAKTAPARDRPQKPRERTKLLRDAQEAELAGDDAKAAELLEAAGEFAAAGRFYERAAARLRS